MATNTPTDYSESIIIPGNIPEHMEAHYIALKRAKRVIHILSRSTLHVKTREYTIPHGTHEKMILPEEYQFERFQIRFLPGWGTYSVVLDNGKVQISIRTPHGREEFEEDLKLIENFIKTYGRLSDSEPRYREPKISEQGSSYDSYLKSNPPLSKRKQAVINFRNKLHHLGRGFGPAAE